MLKKLFVVSLFSLLICGCVEVGDGTASNSLIRLEELATSENCADGETIIHTGIDADNDGQLSDEEIVNTYSICNGQEDVGPAIPGGGSYLESSDGKYIGEIVGIANPQEYFYSSCVFVYNPDADGFFGVTLETATPCNTKVVVFENFLCTFSGSIYTSLPMNTSWRILNPTNGDVYAVVSEEYDVYYNSYLHSQDGKCRPCEDAYSEKLRLLNFTGVTIDFGQPPILVKIPERG